MLEYLGDNKCKHTPMGGFIAQVIAMSVQLGFNTGMAYTEGLPPLWEIPPRSRDAA